MLQEALFALDEANETLTDAATLGSSVDESGSVSFPLTSADALHLHRNAAKLMLAILIECW